MKLLSIQAGQKMNEYLLTIESAGSETVHVVEVFDHGGIRGVSFQGELREIQRKNPMPFKPVVGLVTRYAQGDKVLLPFDMGAIQPLSPNS